MTAANLEAALDAWRAVTPELGALTGDECAPYLENCLNAPREIAAVLKPRSERAVVQIVKIAAAHKVPLYPISTGRNWGYGSALPAADGCVVVDLSHLRGIHFDFERGLVEVQPGVTQGDLSRHLSESGYDYMVPTTGAGPSASLVGNALERGYGLTPIADHFAAVTSLRAVLPNGEVYRPSLDAWGAPAADKGFKWGLGPYLDGLFTQGSFGIVTSMTIALARRPSAVGVFTFTLNSEGALDAAVAAVRDVFQLYPGQIGGINLMNSARLSAMGADVVGQPAWMGVGGMYGDRRTLGALRHAIKRRFASVDCRVRFFSKRKIRLLHGLAPWLPRRYADATEKLADLHALLSGYPRETALQLAYTKLEGYTLESGLNPARDGCGLIWYSPLVPMIGESVREFIDMVSEVGRRFETELPITLTTISGANFDATVPIVYDKPDGTAEARECYALLLAAGRGLGFPVYRLPVDQIGSFIDQRHSDTCWQMVSKLKQAIDPDGIIAPGRYAPR